MLCPYSEGIMCPCYSAMVSVDLEESDQCKVVLSDHLYPIRKHFHPVKRGNQYQGALESFLASDVKKKKIHIRNSYFVLINNYYKIIKKMIW